MTKTTAGGSVRSRTSGAASSPVTPGISTSRNTTSYLRIARELEGVRGVRRLAHDDTSACACEQVAQLAARGRLIVDEERANHAAGTSRRTTVPNGNDRRRTPSP